MKTQRRKQETQTTPVTRGIQLRVTGAALAAQATERIAWHERSASALSEELQGLTKGDASDLKTKEDWQQRARRSEVQRLIFGHQEYARFLGFIRRHLRRQEIYHLSLVDLDQLEIMPKGRYT